MLHCFDCLRAHNLDEDPDTGECTTCKGPLVEGSEERPGYGDVFVAELMETVAQIKARFGISNGPKN